MGKGLEQDFGAYLVESLIRQQQRNYNHDVDVVTALDDWLKHQDGNIANEISQAALGHYRQEPVNWIVSLQSERGGFVEDYAHVVGGKFSEEWKENPILQHIFAGHAKVSVDDIHLPFYNRGNIKMYPFHLFQILRFKSKKKCLGSDMAILDWIAGFCWYSDKKKTESCWRLHWWMFCC